MSDLSYWYNSVGGSNIISDLPPQAIPSSEKKDKWKEATMDALERIGIKQFRENLRFADYYRMASGKLSYREMSDLMPQLRELSDLMEDFKLPTTIQHYDLLGIIVNYLQAVMVENKDKFHPTNIDEISSNERQRKMDELIQAYVKEEWSKELKIKLIENGLDPDRTNFSSPEEQQAYIQEIQVKSEALTPPQIKEYMEKEWKPAGVRWAEATLEAEEQTLGTNEIDRECIKDYLLTGRFFQHYFIKYDSHSVERWGTINTFISQTVDMKYPQFGEYVGRVHFYTPSDFINKKGYHFSEQVKKKILNVGNVPNKEGFQYTFEDALNHNFQERHLVPHANYYDYNFLTNLEEEFGIPLATRTIHRKDGTTEVVRDFLPKAQRFGSNVNRYASFLREDLNLRTDMIMVTEAYWRSYQRVGLLTYIAPDGRVETEIVTDEIYKDFLEENGIKEIKNISLEEAMKKKTPNTIVWDYKPEIWKGEKAQTANTNLQEDLYYDIKPLEYQIKGDSNIFDVQLPVAGIVDTNPSDKIMPWQFLYNVACNKERDLHEKELGVFFLFDINYLPADIKEYGDTETSLLHTIRAIKDSGLLGLDTSKTNNPQGAQFNNFGMQDMSLSAQIRDTQVLAEHYKMKAYEQFGLNPNTLGAPQKYVTATGEDIAAHSTDSQTDYLYEAFSGAKKRAIEIQLAVSQYAHSNGKDLSVEYTKGDLTNAFLYFSAQDMIPLRRIGIMAVSSSKKRREVERMKQYLLNQNTQDADSLEISSIINSDSMHQLIEIARLERKRKDLIRQREMEHERALQQESFEAQKQTEIRTWTLKERTEEANRRNKIDLERIKSLGRAVDNESTPGGLDYITQAADYALAQEKQENDYDLQLRDLNEQIEDRKEKYKASERDFALKLKELQEKKEKRKSDEYIATINKA